MLMPLNSGMPERSFRTLYGLLRTSCIAGPCGMHLFCLSAAPFWTTKHYVQVSRNESLSYTQSESRGVSPRLDHCLDWTSYWIYLFTYYRQFTPASLSCSGDVFTIVKVPRRYLQDFVKHWLIKLFVACDRFTDDHSFVCTRPVLSVINVVFHMKVRKLTTFHVIMSWW